jgi:hypothetical protein
MPIPFGDLDDDPASRDTSVEVCINNQMPSRSASPRARQGLLGPPLFWYGSSIVRRNN